MPIGGISNDDLVETLMSLPTPASLFERLPGGEFRLVVSNDEVKKLYKTDPSPEGRKLDELTFSEAASENLRAAFDVCCRSRMTHSAEFRWVLRDGTVIYTNFTAVPLVENGEVVRIISTSFDITDLVLNRQKHAEEINQLLSGYIRICAWCNSIKRGDQWVKPADWGSDIRREQVLCPACGGDAD